MRKDYAVEADSLKPYIVPWIAAAVAAGGAASGSAGASGTLTAHELNGPFHMGTLARNQAPWVATDIVAGVAAGIATHEAAPDPHPTYVKKAGDTMTGPLLLPNGGTSVPSIAFASDPDNGFYRVGENILGIPKTLTAGWVRGSMIGFGGQNANDLGMLGFYDRNELTNADVRGSVTVSITGAGSVTAGSVNNMLNAKGGYMTITGTNATTTQIVIQIDLGATTPNYGSAFWQPFLQYRLFFSNTSGSTYRGIVVEVSANGTTWLKPASGAWESADMSVGEVVPGLWMGGNAQPGVTWRYARFTLTNRVAGTTNADQVWISQIGLRHYSAQYTRAWLHASGDTAYGPMVVKTGNAAALDVETAAGVSVFTVNTSAALATVNGDLEVLDTLTAANAAIGTTYDPTATLKVQSVFNDDVTLFLKQTAGQTARMWRVEDSAGQELIVLDSQGNLQSGNPGFVSGLTGWQITPAGNAELNNAFIRGELHASIFVMDEFHASGGTFWVAPAGKLELDATVTVTTGVEAVFDIRTTSVSGSGSQFDIRTTSVLGSGSQFTLRTIENYIELTDPPSGHAMVLQPGDRIRCKALGLSVGINLWDVWGIVQAVADMGDYYRYYYTRTSGGTNGLIIPAGTAIISYGPPGAGRIYLTADQNYAPYMQVFLSGEEPWNGQITPTVRIGRLDGVGLPGVSGIEQHGMVLSSDLSDASAPYLVASNLQVRQYKIDSEWNNGNPTARITANGEFRLGTDVDADNTTGLKFNPATGALDIGNPGYPGAVNVTGIITVKAGSSGIGTFSDANLDNIANGATYGRINNTIIGGGFIRVGSGNKDSTLNGWYIDAGEIVGQAAGVDQVVMDTGGKLSAGAGALQLDRTAFHVANSATSKGIQFYNTATFTDGNKAGRLWALNGTPLSMYMSAGRSTFDGDSTNAAGIMTLAAYNASGGAPASLRLTGSAGTVEITGTTAVFGDLNMNGYDIIDANNCWAVRSTAPL